MSIRSTIRIMGARAILTLGMFVVLMALTLIIAQYASAHGYVDAPASRSILCKQGVNTDCGSIVYEPQSLETTKGFPNAGPADGKIASANGAFPKLDEQSSTRWSKVQMTPGTRTFTWKFTANHATTNFRYFITKPNWNPNAALTRDQLELTPFCTINYNGAQPPMTLSHDCDVPVRTGYHIILAVWDVDNTANAFYNAIDVQFASGPADTTSPTAPSGLSASNVGTTSATLTWSGSTDNVGVTGYKIYNGSTLLTTVPSSPTTRTLTGLTSSTSYAFKVTAVDAAGNESASSNTVSVTTGQIAVDTQAPSAPPGLHIMGAPTSASMMLMWSPSTDNVGVAGYRIYRGTTLVATVGASATDYTVTGLTASTTYAFSVVAFDAAGNTSASSNISGTTAAPPAEAPWAPGVHYTAGTRVTYNGVVYACRQTHTSLTGWEPPNVLALWLPV
jgi:chitin-binding protein